MEKLLSVKDLAAVLGYKPDTVRKLCQAEKLPFVRINGRPKFRPSDIERFIETRRVYPGRAKMRRVV